MIELLSWILRKLFLVREIVSRKGVVHFQRYRVISTPWFKIYLHRILESDQDKDLHSHPWDFKSLVIKGSYKEYYAIGPYWGLVKERTFKPFQVNSYDHNNVHKIEVMNGPVWTLFFTNGRLYEWGYQTKIGFIENKRYRIMKRFGQI